MDADPARAMRNVHEVVLAARSHTVAADQLLAALTALRFLRDELGNWEPELIAAARAGGASWAALAPALGVASRQAAERRFLRLRPSVTGEQTGEARVDAERDRRAGDRAVADWARRNSAVLRQVAGQVSGLDGLGTAAQHTADRVGAALGDDDVTTLLPNLATLRGQLTAAHSGLADRLGSLSDDADQVRREATEKRRDRTT
ncbi:MAG: HSP18 transcriptional regulator [Actinophytocola sp.]|uniref:HSP18 transcriptional regulator n=1 Tax=Actinophytocola sp. TaxID=1872138 RepID=UPI003C71EDE9